MTDKKGPGRPKKEEAKDFSELSDIEILLHTYNGGGSDSKVCKELQITKEDFDERYKTDLTFQAAVDYGRVLELSWFEEACQFGVGMMPAKDPFNKFIIEEGKVRYKEVKLQAPLIALTMKNRFGWAEKAETTNKDIFGVEGLTKEEAEQQLRDLGVNITDIMEAKKKKG